MQCYRLIKLKTIMIMVIIMFFYFASVLIVNPDVLEATEAMECYRLIQ